MDVLGAMVQTTSEANTMKSFLIALVLALSTSAVPALALTSNLNIRTPIVRNSGAGIAGYPGDESGPAAHPGAARSAARNQIDAFAWEQDPAKIPGLPGTESGPSATPPARSA